MALDTPLHVGDITNYLQIVVLVDGQIADISDATGLQIKIQKPDGTVLTKTEPQVEFTTDGTDGKFRYQVASGDLDKHGRYLYQGRLTSTSLPFDGHTEIKAFQVEDVLGS